MRHVQTIGICVLVGAVFVQLAGHPAVAADPPVPAHADVSYGPHANQLLDIYLPTQSGGPFPVVLWYGGIWKPNKHPANLGYFLSHGVAMVAVQTRTMADAVADKVEAPVAYVMQDACRAVQFIRLNAAKWNLDPQHIAVGGGSQGSLPALYVGCSGEHANPQAADPVERVSTQVAGVAAFRSQPSIDPKQLQDWMPGVKWGAPALGCTFEQSLERREALLPLIDKWSPDHLLHQGAPPIYFENEWGLTQPEGFTEANYKTHCPQFAIGFQKLAEQAGVACYTKYLDHPTEKYKDTWDFLVQQVKASQP